MSLDKDSDPLRRIPTKHTAALRAEIGPILRAARLKRGQSLEAVAQQTRISKRFLEALEDNRFEQFPAVVYLRGFLKGYCEHLDVNFEEIWAMLNSSPAPEEAPADASSATATSAASHGPQPATPHGQQTAKGSLSSPAHARGPAPLMDGTSRGSGATGAIALAVVLGLALMVWIFKDKGGAAVAPVSTAPAALQPMPRVIEPKLIMRLKSDAWLRVSVDGQVVFEGRAPRDAVQEWKPSRFVNIRTMEPAALDLSLNGLPVQLGAPQADGQYRVEIP